MCRVRPSGAAIACGRRASNSGKPARIACTTGSAFAAKARAGCASGWRREREPLFLASLSSAVLKRMSVCRRCSVQRLTNRACCGLTGASARRTLIDELVLFQRSQNMVGRSKAPVSVLLFLFLIASVGGFPPQTKPPVEAQTKTSPFTDQDGNALPPFAVLRIGVHRVQHVRGVRSAIFSPNGAFVALASDNRGVALWDVASGKHLRTRLAPEKGFSAHTLTF